MDRLVGNDIQKTRDLFEEFNYYKPVIFSIFENQYDGLIYTNNKNKPDWAILQTPFLQHIIAGKPTNECEAILEEILFTIILNEQHEKEIVVFFNNDEWNEILQRIFEKRNDVCDFREIFHFSHENFNKLNQLSIPNNIQVIVEKCKVAPNSRKDTWSVKLILEGQIISRCEAIMAGKNMAEIDIATEETFRGKGYATIAGTILINKLIEEKLTPCWSTWPFRKESQHIAQELGFTHQKDVKAWIWLNAR
jgi:hypothetical protein